MRMTINNAPMIMPMISSTPRVRDTTAPASRCSGRTAKADGATTKLKKAISPSHKPKIASLIFCVFIRINGAGESIARDRRVNLQRPFVNAADQVFDVGEALRRQVLAGAVGTHPVMAMQDDLFAFVRQFICPIRDLPERFQLRTFDLRRPVFRGLAHVYQAELLAGV